MDKKWVILLCFFSVLTFISSVVSSFFVFMNDEVRTEANSHKVLANKNIYKRTAINYDENNSLNIAVINLGYNKEYKFNITNNNSNAIKYRIEWQNVSNSWQDSNDTFTYSLNCSNGEKVENKDMPLTNEVIVDNLELATNKTNECTLKINVSNIANQLNVANGSFTGTYKVVIKE